MGRSIRGEASPMRSSNWNDVVKTPPRQQVDTFRSDSLPRTLQALMGFKRIGACALVPQSRKRPDCVNTIVIAFSYSL